MPSYDLLCRKPMHPGYIVRPDAYCPKPTWPEQEELDRRERRREDALDKLRRMSERTISNPPKADPLREALIDIAYDSADLPAAQKRAREALKGN